MPKVTERMPEPGVLSEGKDIDESLTPEETAQMQALKEGRDPAEVTAPKDEGVGAEAPEEALELETDETPEQAEEREAAGKAPAERGLLNEVKREREKRKALEKQLADAAETRARSDERLRIINDMMAKQGQPQQPQLEEAPEPDKELDPLAWYEWKIQQQDKVMQGFQQYQQQNTAQTQAMQLAQQIQMQEAQYAASNPQYTPSINKLATHLDKMFEPMYPDPQQRQWAIGQWTRIAVQRAAELGKNPAQLTYEIAQNAGLTEQEAQAAAATVAVATQPQAPAQNGGAPSLKTVNTARRAAQTLSNVSGRSQNPTPTMEDIDAMSDEDFEAFKDRLKGKSVTQYFFNR